MSDTVAKQIRYCRFCGWKVKSCQCEPDERQRLRLQAEEARRPMHISEVYAEPSPWQEIAIRALEDQA